MASFLGWLTVLFASYIRCPRVFAFETQNVSTPRRHRPVRHLSSPTPAPPQACANTDNGALDSTGVSCEWYEKTWCGKYDDGDFNSTAMCCGCGGGRGQAYVCKLTSRAATSWNNVQRLTGQTLETCKQACHAATWGCKSFDWYRNSNECDLSDTCADDADGWTTNYSGIPYDHYSCDCQASRQEPKCLREEIWRNQSLLDYSNAFERCGPEMFCRKGHKDCEDFCEFDEECEGYPLRLCHQVEKKCLHKGLFKGSVGPDIGAAMLFFFISGLALSAGIGGGGLYVPLLMVILGFNVQEATGLSQACLSGGASTALIYNLRQRHPSGKKPMIDYTLVLVMGPNLLIGSLIGSTLNASAPSWLIFGLLMAVLCQSVWKTMTKAIATFKKERAGQVRGVSNAADARLSKNPIERCIRTVSGKKHERFEDGDSGVVVGRPADGTNAESNTEPGTAYVVGKPLGRNNENVTAESNATSGHVLSASDADKLGGSSGGGAPDAGGSAVAKAPNGSSAAPDAVDIEIAGSQAADAPPQFGGSSAAGPVTSTPSQSSLRQYPRRKLAGFATIWLLTVLCIFVRGGKATQGLVDYCSPGYWIVAAITMMALAAISFQAARRAIAEGRAGEDEGELQWTALTARMVVRWSLGAGTLAALCGIGGGMVMGPILLDLGFLPQVQSATTATTLFVLSSSTCLAFLVAGTIPPEYAFWLAFATGTGAVFGKAGIGYVVKKFRRPSLIMFLLGGIILASVIVMGITGIIDIVNDINHGKDMLFKGLCHTSS